MYACRDCGYVSKQKVDKCPMCGSTAITEDFGGLIIILNEESNIAKILNIKKPGRYALFFGEK